MVNQAVIKPSVSFYFPELSNQQLFSILQALPGNIKQLEVLLEQHWEVLLSEETGLLESSIPWNLLRAMQFNIPADVKTAVCCDPVMMQMTHRGAYLWGQQSLDFSKEDVIRIIAQINQQLMNDDECFYLLDNNQWLYTNKKAIELNQPSFEEYIGKDMFGFSYEGKDGTYWDKLATEIQMLIKQMMDYQGLKGVPPEMIVNVHFWGDTNHYLFDDVKSEEIRSKLNELNVYSSNPLIETFSHIKQLNFTHLNHFKITEMLNTKKNIVFIFNNDIRQANEKLQSCIEKLTSLESIKLITQDKVVVLRQPKNWLEKIFSMFKSKSKSKKIFNEMNKGSESVK